MLPYCVSKESVILMATEGQQYSGKPTTKPSCIKFTNTTSSADQNIRLPRHRDRSHNCYVCTKLAEVSASGVCSSSKVSTQHREVGINKKH